jgi:uncharacterized membrane protein YphA (DoxX/SURF4 family)
MIKRIALSFLCSLLGAVFIYSGWVKLMPIEPFEYTFVDLGFINWQVAPFIARLMIGFEFFIGFLLLVNVNLKLTYKLAIAVLLFFCVYLLLLMAFVGNKGNCGCFGDAIQMTPLQALIKNIIMLALFFVLYKFHEGWQLPKKWSKAILIVIACAILSFPFVRNPIELNYSEAYLNQPEENFKLELDSLYASAKLNIPPRTLSEGKHVIAFMSMSCPHCRVAAKKMRIIHERNPAIPMYLVLNGLDEKLQSFFDDTHTENIPHCILNGKNFIFLAGTSMPRIYLVNNSVVEHDMNYIDLDQAELEKWLSE